MNSSLVSDSRESKSLWMLYAMILSLLEDPRETLSPNIDIVYCFRSFILFSPIPYFFFYWTLCLNYEHSDIDVATYIVSSNSDIQERRRKESKIVRTVNGSSSELLSNVWSATGHRLTSQVSLLLTFRHSNILTYSNIVESISIFLEKIIFNTGEYSTAI